MSLTGFAAIWPGLFVRSRHWAPRPSKPEEQLAEIRTQVVTALRRTEAIKARYGNTSAEDDTLKRMLRDRLTAQQQIRSPETSNPAMSPPREPVKDDGKNEASKENATPKS